MYRWALGVNPSPHHIPFTILLPSPLLLSFTSLMKRGCCAVCVATMKRGCCAMCGAMRSPHRLCCDCLQVCHAERAEGAEAAAGVISVCVHLPGGAGDEAGREDSERGETQHGQTAPDSTRPDHPFLRAQTQECQHDTG